MNDEQQLTAPERSIVAAQTPWGPWSGLLGSVAITAGAFAATVLCVTILQQTGVQQTGSSTPAAAQGWVTMAAFQVAMTAGAWWLAGWFGGKRTRVLSLSGTVPTLRDMALILGIFLLFTIPYTWAVYVYRPDVLIADNAPFASLMRSPDWPIYAIIIAIGAPVSEELLFRGFLLPSLAKSRIGFAGAAIVTTVLWMALHFTYSIYGLIEIFMIGLLLSWALRKTRSLWAPLAIHAINNGALALAMKFQLLPWT